MIFLDTCLGRPVLHYTGIQRRKWTWLQGIDNLERTQGFRSLSRFMPWTVSIQFCLIMVYL